MRKFIDIIMEGTVVTAPFGQKPVDKINKIRGGAQVFRFAKRPDQNSLDSFTRAYINAALELSDEELGDEATYDRMHVDSIQQMISDSEEFQKNHTDALEEYYDHGFDEEQAGIDFWLTRNGHGAGFWDRGAGEIGDQLTAFAKAYPEVSLYWGDDRAIHMG